jgi:hypothetical protein
VSWHYRVDCTGTGASAVTADFAPLWQANAPSLRNVDLSRSNLYVRPGEVSILDDENFHGLLARLAVLRLPRHAVGRTAALVEQALAKHAQRLAHLHGFELT